MKKILFLAILSTMMVLGGFTSSIQAQAKSATQSSQTAASLTGTWMTDASKYMGGIEGMNAAKADLTFTFTATTVKVGFDIQCTVQEGEMSMDLGAKVSASGTYTKKGNTLSINLNNQTPKLDLYKFKLNVDAETRAAMKQAGIDENALKTLMAKQLQQGGEFDAMVNSVNTDVTIVKLTPTTLVLKEENESMELTFTRVKQQPATTTKK